MTKIIFLLLVLTLTFSTTTKLAAQNLSLPIIRQSTNYSCGAAALMSVLYYWKVFDGTEADLRKPLKTSKRRGTRPQQIVEVAKSFGLTAELVEKMTLADLEAALAARKTVILDIQAWKEGGAPSSWENIWDDGHYVVLAGMDEKIVTVMDPVLATSYGTIPREELISRWHDFEMERGKRREYFQMGIIVEGKENLEQFPNATIEVQ